MEFYGKPKPRWIKGLVVIGGWALYGLFFTSQTYLSQAFFVKEVRWGQSLAVWMLCAFAWTLLTPAILWMARRFPFTRKDWGRPLLIQIAAAGFFLLFRLAVC